MIRKTERTYRRKRPDHFPASKARHNETYRRTTWWFLCFPVYVHERTLLVEDF